MKRISLTAGSLAMAGLLAACGSGAAGPSQAPAPVESVTDSGDPAFFGTKGVEAVLVNAQWSYRPDTFKLVVRDRNTNESWTLGKGQSVTLRGARSVSDDLEVTISGRNAGAVSTTSEVDLDFSNPSAYCPNVTVQGDNGDFCSVGSESSWTAEIPEEGYFSVSIVRDSDSSDFKRFTVKVNWYPYKMG